MTTPDVTRKIRQLDNDVQSIYEILARIELTQGRHSNRFNEIGEDLDGLRGRLEDHDVRFQAIDARFDAVDERLDGLDTKLDRVIELVTGHNGPR